MSLSPDPQQGIPARRDGPCHPGCGSGSQRPFSLPGWNSGPGNLGTILRIADWFGLAAVFCAPHCVEWANPKVIQASMGSFFRMPVEYLPLTDLVARFPELPVLGTAMDGDSILYGASFFPLPAGDRQRINWHFGGNGNFGSVLDRYSSLWQQQLRNHSMPPWPPVLFVRLSGAEAPGSGLFRTEVEVGIILVGQPKFLPGKAQNVKPLIPNVVKPRSIANEVFPDQDVMLFFQAPFPNKVSTPPPVEGRNSIWVSPPFKGEPVRGKGAAMSDPAVLIAESILQVPSTRCFLVARANRVRTGIFAGWRQQAQKGDCQDRFFIIQKHSVRNIPIPWVVP
ncbi:MAG: hypothetical protein IPJ40_23455 [Saprospirales bacterium]|nr:hypothetical protein [Saprospirales bacterium]